MKLHLNYKIILGVIAGLLMQTGVAYSEVPADYTVEQTGTISSINVFDHVLMMDDAFYKISRDVVVKNAKGKEQKLSDLYSGKRVRMEVLYSGSGNGQPVVQVIYLLN